MDISITLLPASLLFVGACSMQLCLCDTWGSTWRRAACRVKDGMRRDSEGGSQSAREGDDAARGDCMDLRFPFPVASITILDL